MFSALQRWWRPSAAKPVSPQEEEEEEEEEEATAEEEADKDAEAESLRATAQNLLNSTTENYPTLARAFGFALSRGDRALARELLKGFNARLDSIGKLLEDMEAEFDGPEFFRIKWGEYDALYDQLQQLENELPATPKLAPLALPAPRLPPRLPLPRPQVLPPQTRSYLQWIVDEILSPSSTPSQRATEFSRGHTYVRQVEKATSGRLSPEFLQDSKRFMALATTDSPMLRAVIDYERDRLYRSQDGPPFFEDLRRFKRDAQAATTSDALATQLDLLLRWLVKRKAELFPAYWEFLTQLIKGFSGGGEHLMNAYRNVKGGRLVLQKGHANTAEYMRLLRQMRGADPVVKARLKRKLRQLRRSQ